MTIYEWVPSTTPKRTALETAQATGPLLHLYAQLESSPALVWDTGYKNNARLFKILVSSKPIYHTRYLHAKIWYFDVLCQVYEYYAFPPSWSMDDTACPPSSAWSWTFFCVGESICTNRWDLLGKTGHYMQYERCSRKEHAKVSQLHQIPPFQVVHQRWWMQETCPLDLCKFDFIWKMNYEDHFVYSILAFTLKLIFSFLSAWGPARRFYWKVSAWATRCRNLVYHYCRMQYVEFVNSVILQIWLKPSLKGDSVIGVILQIRCWSAQTLPGTKLSPYRSVPSTQRMLEALCTAVLWSCDFSKAVISIRST